MAIRNYDVLSKRQTLSDAEKAQVKENIGAFSGDYNDLNNKPTLSDYVLASDLTTQLSTKVDTQAGYGLSKNDFTDTDKQKLDSAITSETDPVFTASAAHNIQTTDIANWNAKIAGISVNGTEVTPDADHKVAITTGGSYTAGSAISTDNNTISVKYDTDVFDLTDDTVKNLTLSSDVKTAIDSIADPVDLVQGDNISFDTSIPGQIKISATGGGISSVKTDDITITGDGTDTDKIRLKVSPRSLTAGTNISFDDSEEGVLKISASGGGISSVETDDITITGDGTDDNKIRLKTSPMALTEGSNVSFDTSVEGKLVINATGGWDESRVSTIESVIPENAVAETNMLATQDDIGETIPVSAGNGISLTQNTSTSAIEISLSIPTVIETDPDWTPSVDDGKLHFVVMRA